jgi:hypothetical protein
MLTRNNRKRYDLYPRNILSSYHQPAENNKETTRPETTAILKQKRLFTHGEQERVGHSWNEQITRRIKQLLADKGSFHLYFMVSRTSFAEFNKLQVISSTIGSFSRTGTNWLVFNLKWTCILSTPLTQASILFKIIDENVI